MGNRSTIEQRSAAGSDVTNKTNSSKPQSTVPSSSGEVSSAGGSCTDDGVYASDAEPFMERNTRPNHSEDQAKITIEDYNAAVLSMEHNRLELGWNSDFSTVSRSEMTTSDQSKLPSPRTDQTTPFRMPDRKLSQPQTTSTGEAGTSLRSPSPLSSTDTYYGLPPLIEAVEPEVLEAFAKPSPDDEKWVAQTHYYFDNEKVYVRKSTKPSVGRRLRIGKPQKKRWSSIMREMALRHPLPVNPAPFPLSKAMDELKLRPEKRFTMPHN
uniref:Uncharacterized protein n=1 Tax=Haemonchus contortus TaxID=6289 RepID=A0A7I4YW19_HAECO